jgi:uncharacterized protein
LLNDRYIRRDEREVPMTVSDGELLESFPKVVIDHDNKEFYRGWLARQLVLPRCTHCGTWLSTQRPICPNCWSFDLEHRPVSGRGTVHLLIWLHQGPSAPGVDYSTPYPVATVELEEQAGLRYTSTILDVHQDEVQIGDAVTLDWIERYEAPFPVFRRVR